MRALHCRIVRSSITSGTRISIPTAGDLFPARATTPTTRKPPGRLSKATVLHAVRLPDRRGHTQQVDVQPRFQYRPQWRLRHEPGSLSLSRHVGGRHAAMSAMPTATPVPTLTDAPGEQAEAVIRQGLSARNLQQAGYRDQRRLAVLVCDPGSGAVVVRPIGRISMGGARRGCTRGVLFVQRPFPGAWGLPTPGLRRARPARMRSAAAHSDLHDKEARCRALDRISQSI